MLKRKKTTIPVNSASSLIKQSMAILYMWFYRKNYIVWGALHEAYCEPPGAPGSNNTFKHRV